MVVDGPEDFLGRNEQGRHLPDGHLKVHLRELEQSRQGASAIIAHLHVT